LGKRFTERNGSFAGLTARSPEVAAAKERERRGRKKEGGKKKCSTRNVM
jgi:hypothetical protein